MLSGVQVVLYFYTSVESNLHFKGAAWRGTKAEEEDRKMERKDLSGPWHVFDLTFIRQENIEVKSIKV